MGLAHYLDISFVLWSVMMLGCAGILTLFGLSVWCVYRALVTDHFFAALLFPCFVAACLYAEYMRETHIVFPLTPQKHEIGRALVANTVKPTVRIMTFNLRTSNNEDGLFNNWQDRRGLVAQVLMDEQPDVVGSQEGLDEQLNYVADKSGYKWFGQPNGGPHDPQYFIQFSTKKFDSAIFYNPKTVQLLKNATFWLSETPNVSGSKFLNTSSPRTCTWGFFEDLQSHRQFFVFNTHLDFAVEEMRRRQARALLAEIVHITHGHEFVFLTGDFNCIRGSTVWNIFQAYLNDTWSLARTRSSHLSTFHNFWGHSIENIWWRYSLSFLFSTMSFEFPRIVSSEPFHIDWVLGRGNFDVVKSQVVDFHQHETYPSDHYPVISVIHLRDDTKRN